MTTISQTLRRWAEEDRQVQADAVRRNLRVLSVAAWVLVALNVLHVAVFTMLRFDDPVRDAWAQQIAVAHGVMGGVMGGVGWLARHLRARVALASVVRALPTAVSAMVLAWAIVLTVMDQAVSTSINPFVNAAVGVAIVFLLPPRTAVVLMVLAWIGLAWALGLTTQDAALLTTNRMNAASAAALALLVSVLFWRHYARSERLQRALTESNRQLERQRAELETLATRDPLTGLLNRREFVRQAELELARARRQGSPLSVLMLDLDHFKSINDRFGHPVGDEVLRQVALCMGQAIRQTDRIARFGGEEFVLLLPDTAADNAMLLADKLQQGLTDIPIPVLDAPLTASVGLVWSIGVDVPNLEMLLEHADQALYQAKRDGRNRIVAKPVGRAPARV